MKIPVVKKLVEEYSSIQLQEAEEAILEENAPSIEVEGEDEGEQLTHIMAAIWIQEKMKMGVDFKIALREYTGKVRNSISLD
ncbi:MAG: hypothetical protein OEY34_08400 [Cyclobacteriaceae bacterium]|nr:hypothetical protein [Cyclobacteriaceae bacterium]